MGEEVELEARPQVFLRDLADASLPGSACIGDDDIDAAEGRTRGIEGGAHLARLRHVAGHRQRARADARGNTARRRFVDVEYRDLRALGGKGLDRRGADAAPAAGDERDMSRQRLLRALAELGLLERPVLDVEQVGLTHRGVAADGLGRRDHLDGRLGEVGGNARVFRRRPEAKQAEPGHQNHPRQGIERRLVGPGSRVVAGEVGAVVGGEARDRGPDLGGEGIQALDFGRRHEQRSGLGADDVVGGDDPGRGVSPELGPADIVEDRR